MAGTRLLAGVALFFTACGGAAEIPLEYRPDDVAIVAATVDHRLVVSLEPFGADSPITVESDEGSPVYTWVLRQEDFVEPGGAPIAPAVLQQVVPRLSDVVPDPNGNSGACNRCFAPTRTAPQVINEGESCTIPSFVRGAIWKEENGSFVCSGAADSPICSAGPEADQKLVEEVRRLIRIDWPGPCACNGEPEATSLEGLDVRPISPVAAPYPMNAFAQDQEGRVAGFSTGAAILYDPTTMATDLVRIEDWPVTVEEAIALRDGGGFLVASREFNTGFLDKYRFDRFEVADGRLVGPIEVAREHLARPRRIEYLGDHPDFPLYLLGNIRGNLGIIEPAMFACNDASMACQRAGLEQCEDESQLANVLDVEILPGGSGFALADHAFYYRASNAPPRSNPDPNDPWTCSQNRDPWPWRGEAEEPVKTRLFSSLGRAGNRLFVCGLTSTPPCEPDYAVVLTATITSSVGVVPDPSWEVVYRGSDWTRCGSFLEVPGAPNQTRLHLSGQRLVDFDATGAVVQETSIADVYGEVPGLHSLLDLAQPGFAALQSNESQLFLKEEGAPLTRIYGGEARERADYRAAVALGEGDFLAFGHPDGAARIRVLESTVDGFPEVDVRVLADPTGAIKAGDALRDAVLDRKETEAAGVPVVLVAGERESDTLLLRLVVGDGEILRSDVLTPPGSVDDLGAVRIGEAAPGQFVVGTEGTRILRVVNDEVTELDIDFDDPDTEEVEVRPTREPNACSGNVPRLDAWRAVDGKNGVAWVVGSDQLAFRVTGDRVERFMGAASIEYSALRVTCPDDVLLAGRGHTVDLAGVDQFRMQFWGVAPVEMEEEEISLGVRRGQALQEVGEEQITSISILSIVQGYPRAVFPDVAEGGGPAQHRPFAVALSNGYLPRFFAASGLDHVRPPFSPEVVVQSPGGYVLYGGRDSRLALGVPKSKR